VRIVGDRLAETSPTIFSPKGWDYLAQGNALGQASETTGSLKGCDNVVAAFQAASVIDRVTQSVALG
jgi:hypothetical protein